MADIKCSVDSCEYWGEGQVCTADSIQVKNSMASDSDDELGTGRGGMEVGSLGNEGRLRARSTTAKTSSDTCCETMRPRGARKL